MESRTRARRCVPPRLGHPEEFAALAEHIIENDYLNAEAIRLDAGTRLGPRSR
jgi:3-hydroxyacyl-CoA dehydrogenase / 3-hydroxy-2-methylbutyryl-CoA dehydrogenase